MRKISLILIIAFIFMFLQIPESFANEKIIILDDSKLSSGVIGVKYTPKITKRIKLYIKNGEKEIGYNILNNEMEYFSLQFGNGEYTLKIYENIKDNSFKFKMEEKINLKLKDDKLIYLNSIQNVKWDNSMSVIKKAKELTKNAKNDTEKVKIIYNYVIKQLEYDFDKANNVQINYLPDISTISNDKKGICYDYASLFAAMLRSINIPTKLVTGQSTYVDVYHAWNEVYLSDSKKWVIIDTTVDDALLKGKKKVNMYKSEKDYTKRYEY